MQGTTAHSCSANTRIDFIKSIFAPGEVDEIWITFADPQPKSPNRRLTSPVFLDRYRAFLKPGGIINLKTDSQLLHEYTLEVAREQGLEIMEANNDIYGTGRVTEEDILNVKTYYEQKFLAEGLPITYMAFRLK